MWFFKSKKHKKLKKSNLFYIDVTILIFSILVVIIYLIDLCCKVTYKYDQFPEIFRNVMVLISFNGIILIVYSICFLSYFCLLKKNLFITFKRFVVFPFIIGILSYLISKDIKEIISFKNEQN